MSYLGLILSGYILVHLDFLQYKLTYNSWASTGLNNVYQPFGQKVVWGSKRKQNAVISSSTLHLTTLNLTEKFLTVTQLYCYQ